MYKTRNYTNSKWFYFQNRRDSKKILVRNAFFPIRDLMYVSSCSMENRRLLLFLVVKNPRKSFFSRLFPYIDRCHFSVEKTHTQYLFKFAIHSVISCSKHCYENSTFKCQNYFQSNRNINIVFVFFKSGRIVIHVKNVDFQLHVATQQRISVVIRRYFQSEVRTLK